MIELPFSDACERNKEPILEVLKQVLPDSGQVLEVGSGTGQHVVFFAAELSGLTWQPSDREENLPGLSQRIGMQMAGNIREAILLDVNKNWPQGKFDAVFSSNTAHIMDWESVCAMFAGVGSLLPGSGVFCLYGPFNEQGKFTSASNERFNRSLREQDPVMGIRDLEALESLAGKHQMMLSHQFRLPANNSLLVFRKTEGHPDVRSA